MDVCYFSVKLDDYYYCSQVLPLFNKYQAWIYDTMLQSLAGVLSVITADIN